MGFITNLRIRLGKRFLNKEAAKLYRRRKAVNLEATREIGILFHMQSEVDYDRVCRFSRELQEVGKRVQVIGFYDYRKLPPYYAQKLAYDIILPGHLDIFYRPKVDFVAKFIEYEFDMLIDLGTSDDFPLHYIATLSKAGFKLGRSSGEGGLPYDLMIETGNLIESDELIRQIVHYTSAFKLE
ncbi:MAG: hypothetical protein FD166_1344 [Bacteroidetes bacterium]|nr:MAG: hypothetical protein FD166_1344 [Bacteroidota bacterium]